LKCDKGGRPKPDGRKRPLGVASLEDKIVQQAVLWVLQFIYEQDFLGCGNSLCGLEKVDCRMGIGK